MKEDMLPQMAESPMRTGKASYNQKCFFHERILCQYLSRKIEGWSVSAFLDAEKIENYALYAITDFTYFFLNDLKHNNKSYGLEVICDKNAKEFPLKMEERMVLDPDELASRYKRKQINKIIIMSIIHENEITDELLGKGILLNDIISFVSVLYS